MPANLNLSRLINVIWPTGYTAANTTTITSSEIDLGADYDSFLVLCKIGTAATDNTLGVTTSATSGGTFAANGITAEASDGTNTLIAIEVIGSKHRYLKTVVTRATSTTIEAVIVIPFVNKGGHSDPEADWTEDADFVRFLTPSA